MLEFLAAIVIYIAALFGVASNTNEVEVPLTNFKFTLAVFDDDSKEHMAGCGEAYYKFIPLECRGITTEDTICYSNPNMTGIELKLDAGTIFSIFGINESATVYKLTRDESSWYVPAMYTNLISEEVLGVSTHLYIDDSEIPDFFIADEQDCDIKLAYAMYRLLPDYITSWYESKGYDIHVTNVDLQEAYDRDAAIAGITVHREKAVYLSNKSATIKYSIYHEIGHVLDQYFGGISDTEEFVDIFQEEVSTVHAVGLFVDDYQKKSPQEFFAVIVNNYFLTGDYYEWTAPRAYEYLKRYLTKIENGG